MNTRLENTNLPPNTDYLELNFVGETATGRGNNQQFIMENLHDGTFRITEARIGITIGRHRPKSRIYPMDQWDTIFQSKINRGYLITKTRRMEKKIISQSNYNGINYKPVNNISVDRIISRLLQYANVAISSNYSIKVDDISDEMISYGDAILKEIAIGFNSMSVAEFNAKMKTLYAAIPRRMDKLSKYLAKSKSNFNDIIANEQELFNIMVSRVRSGQRFNKYTERPTILEAYGLEWNDVTPKEEEMLKKMLGENAREYIHAWKIINHGTERRFKEFCRKEQLTEENGISHLFHGSRNENFWSIVTTGLSINPTNVVITGKMFGNGSYFATLAKKSLGYTSRSGSYWVHGSQKSGLLAVYKVATGKHYDVYRSQSDLNWTRLQERCPGAHCTWAHAGQQLRNDEIIVYQDAQSTIEYLIEMSA